MQIGLEIPYAPVFSSSALPETYNNLVYERAGVLFNLAALYSQLGAAEDRTTPHGLKQAIKFYQVDRLLAVLIFETNSAVRMQLALSTICRPPLCRSCGDRCRPMMRRSS